MTKCLYGAVCAVLLACNAAADGLDLNKDAVSVNPPDPQGSAVIAGPPGCIAGYPPVYITAVNRRTGMTVNSSALPDGSFGLRVPAAGGDAVKLTFFSRSGKKKDMSVRIPGAGEGEGTGARGHERAEVNVDLSPFAQFGAPEVVQVKPDGRGGTRVHVGRRPPQPIPAGTPAGTAASPPTPSPETVESPPALPGTGEVIMPNNTPSHPETDRSPSRRME